MNASFFVTRFARHRLAIDPWMRVLGGDGRVMALGDCSCAVYNQLPATAQVASQQGEALGKLFTRMYDFDGGEGEAGLVVGRDLPPPKSTQGKNR